MDARRRSTRSPLSVGAGSASLGLGVTLVCLVATGRQQPAYVLVLLAALSTAVLVTGALLAVANCPESRVMSAVLATLTVAGTLLSTSVGTPGAGPVVLGPGQYVLLVLGSLVPVLLLLDARRRPATRERPYAL